MITISQKIEELINRSPNLREGISGGIINISALARQIKPQIETELVNDVTETAVFMALQRYSRSIKPFVTAHPGHYLSNLTLRSDLFELTLVNSDSLIPCLSSFMQNFQQDHSLLFVFTQGLHETTIIASNSLEESIKAVLADEVISGQHHGLTAISLQRTDDHLSAIGVLMYPLRILAWQGVSVVKIVTTSNELMIVMKDTDIDIADVSVRQALHSTGLLPEN